jgi:beta-lactamase regulating signal transducer with metallopeptidase domain
MNPDLLLAIVSSLAGFILKTMLAFGVCLVLTRLADSPNRRFTVWLLFLCGTAAYWLWLANSIFSGGLFSSSAGVPRVPAQHVISSAALQIPASWAFALGVALRVLGIAYLVVLSCILVAHIRKQRHLRWVLRFTTKPPAEIAELFQSLAADLHASRARLRVLSGVASPATFGSIRPVILLPDLCLQQDRYGLEDILRHELHHIRRWDFVWNGFAVICRALLFFHPATWYAVRRMQFDRELACDLAVVADSPWRRVEYAECLVHFARLNASQDPTAWGIDFAASSEHLRTRVQSILTGSKQPSSWLLALRIACGVIFLVGFFDVAPSMAVLLSYGHRQTTQPLISTTAPSHSEAETRVRTTRRLRTFRQSASQSRHAIVGSAEETEAPQPVVNPSVNIEPAGPSSTQNSAGPQLLRRPSVSGNSPAAANTTKQQSVVFADTDASSQIGKSGEHDKAQVLQQSITAAAGMYRRMGTVDRH